MTGAYAKLTGLVGGYVPYVSGQTAVGDQIRRAIELAGQLGRDLTH